MKDDSAEQKNEGNTAPCPLFGQCGGCTIQDKPYEEQHAQKEVQARELLAELANMGPEEAFTVHPAPDAWRYRNKMEFSFGEDETGVLLGMHKRGCFWKIVDIEDCLIAPEAFKGVMVRIKQVVSESGLPVYNQKRKQGFWRHLVLRYSTLTGKVMVVLGTHSGNAEYISTVAHNVLKEFPVIESFYWGVSTKVSDVAIPDELFLLGGAPVLEDGIGPITLKVHPLSFIQPNIRQAARLYEDIKRLAGFKEDDVLLDLYCGMGSIGLFCADKVYEVFGIEENHINVRLACENAELNNIDNAHFIQANVEKMLKRDPFYLRTYRPDIIIVDPPRAGLHKKVYAPLLDAHPRKIVYVSCNLKSLARDVRALMAAAPSYRISVLEVYDMFPQTLHLETLLILEKKES